MKYFQYMQCMCLYPRILSFHGPLWYKQVRYTFLFPPPQIILTPSHDATMTRLMLSYSCTTSLTLTPSGTHKPGSRTSGYTSMMRYSQVRMFTTVDFSCIRTLRVVYTGNLWFVWPIDCNAKHSIFQSINYPYTQHGMFKRNRNQL